MNTLNRATSISAKTTGMNPLSPGSTFLSGLLRLGASAIRRARSGTRAAALTCLGCMALVSASGCLFAPTHETEVADRETGIAIKGTSGIPDHAVRILAGASPDGPFQEVATLATDSLSQFSGRTVIPRELWRASCENRRFETYVRAEFPEGGDFFTFDPPSVAGTSGLECITEHVAREDLATGLAECPSADSPVVRVMTEETWAVLTDYHRDLIIGPDTDLSPFECLKTLHSSLIIDDGRVRTVSLPRLQQVRGNVTLTFDTDPLAVTAKSYSREEGIMKGSQIDWMDLPSLTTVHGSIVVRSPNPPDVSSRTLFLDIGLPALAHLGGDLMVEIEALHLDIAGLLALHEISGSIHYGGAQSANTGSGFLTNLSVVSGSLNMLFGSAGGSAMEWFSQLLVVHGDMAIQGGSLGAGDAFLRLKEVGRSLDIIQVEFADEHTLQLESLGYVGEALAFHGTTAWPSSGGGAAERFGTAPVSVGSLMINEDHSLTDAAAALDHFDIRPTGFIGLTRNPNLSQCEAIRAVAALPGHTGPTEVWGNEPCS